MKLSDLQREDRAKLLSGPYTGLTGTYKGLNTHGSSCGLMKFDDQPGHRLVALTDCCERLAAADAKSEPAKPKRGKTK